MSRKRPANHTDDPHESGTLGKCADESGMLALLVRRVAQLEEDAAEDKSQIATLESEISRYLDIIRITGKHHDLAGCNACDRKFLPGSWEIDKCSVCEEYFCDDCLCTHGCDEEEEEEESDADNMNVASVVDVDTDGVDVDDMDTA